MNSTSCACLKRRPLYFVSALKGIDTLIYPSVMKHTFILPLDAPFFNSYKKMIGSSSVAP